MIKRILVANRGEIAVRVMRSCREMEITSIAIFSEADRTAKHVLYADEAYCVGPAASKESYLNIDKICPRMRLLHDAVRKKALSLSVPIRKQWKQWATRFPPASK